MIVVSLTGGLGNQMFQYAAARRLAVKHNTKLYLDDGSYKKNKLRTYALDAFNIKGERLPAVRKYIVRKIKKRWSPRIFWNWSWCVLKQKPMQYVYEKDFGFEPEFLDLPDNVYLCGYRQCERYFEDVEDVIRQDFTLKNSLGTLASNWKKEINNSTNSVSLHVRRGDYVGCNKHYVPLMEHYQKSISMLQERLGDLNIYVFSDGLQWTKENIHFEHRAHYVDLGKDGKDYEEMFLMSQCEHNIIANSSFSWWGAWLNNNANKMVFAPSVWFANSELDASDIVPDKWIKI